MNEFKDAQCPKCGAHLEVPANLDLVSCINCGYKFAIQTNSIQGPVPKQQTKTPCPDCAGKGNFFCRTCNGTGRCFGYALNVNEGISKYCLNGWCPRCNGTGSYIQLLFSETCTHCRGIRVCPTCRGTGKCYACSGSGNITCSRCNGTGTVG